MIGSNCRFCGYENEASVSIKCLERLDRFSDLIFSRRNLLQGATRSTVVTITNTD
jgi:hypothetical protein